MPDGVYRKARDFIDPKLVDYFRPDKNIAYIGFEMAGNHVIVGLHDVNDGKQRPSDLFGYEIVYKPSDYHPPNATIINAIYDRASGEYIFDDSNQETEDATLMQALQIMIQTLAVERGGMIEFYPERIRKAEEQISKWWPNGIHVHFEAKDTHDGRKLAISLENALRCPYHDGNKEPTVS
jgi:hypothetical protein